MYYDHSTCIMSCMSMFDAVKDGKARWRSPRGKQVGSGASPEQAGNRSLLGKQSLPPLPLSFPYAASPSPPVQKGNLRRSSRIQCLFCSSSGWDISLVSCSIFSRRGNPAHLEGRRISFRQSMGFTKSTETHKEWRPPKVFLRF